jgi:hypothetical protein
MVIMIITEQVIMQIYLVRKFERLILSNILTVILPPANTIFIFNTQNRKACESLVGRSLAKLPLVASIVHLTWVVNEPGREHELGIQVTQDAVWWQAVKNAVMKGSSLLGILCLLDW